MTRDERITQEQFQATAGELGLAYEPNVKIHSLPSMPLYGDHSLAANGLRGQHQATPVLMFHLTLGGADPESAEERLTVVLFRNVDLPEFDCVGRSHSLVHRMMRPKLLFDPAGQGQATRETIAAFERQYVLLPVQPTNLRWQGSTEDQLRDLFRAPLLAALAQRPSWRIQSANDCLALAYRGHVPPEKLRTVWDEALSIRTALQTPPPRAEPVLPAPPGMDLGRQEKRLIGRCVGGMIGGILGFFGGVIVVASIQFAGRPGDDHPLARTPFFVIIGLLVGIIGGALLGGWLKTLWYNPEQPWRPTVRIEASGCATTAWAAIGWMTGGALGMLLLILLSESLPRWAIPIVFFGPPVLGLILGGFVAQWIATRRAQP